jgi:hypothetical protein
MKMDDLNSGYKITDRYCNIGKFHITKITNGDLVIECQNCEYYEVFQFGGITRAQFEVLPGPLYEL